MSAVTTSHDQIESLRARAETGEQWAEICRLEAEIENGPFYAADGRATAMRPLEDLSALWIATLVEGVAVLMIIAAIFVWLGLATGGI